MHYLYTEVNYIILNTEVSQTAIAINIRRKFGNLILWEFVHRNIAKQTYIMEFILSQTHNHASLCGQQLEG